MIFRMDWLDLLAVQGTLKSLLQHHSSKGPSKFMNFLVATFVASFVHKSFIYSANASIAFN